MADEIAPHNRRAAETWSSGGDAYNRISSQIASALNHCVLRLDPRRGEHILDVGTGTGWTSRLLARYGAVVNGADIATDLLASAHARAHAEGLDIQYDLGEAENLPYADESFDAVISTFGVMFAGDPEAAAQELARVCRRGGRLGLATWLPEGNVYRMFMVMRSYMPPPPAPPPPSPFAWGDPQRIEELFGRDFDLKFEHGTTTYYDRDGQAAWEAFSTGYGPTKALAASLDEERRAELRRDFEAFHDGFATELGIAVPREYLIAIGTRR
ncbi:MAG TPA: class I SAM-dependent methyltransferase [Methylocella sp.]|nr:class I SAM-dependent methyltransferase [Methylocella sp.]